MHHRIIIKILFVFRGIVVVVGWRKKVVFNYKASTKRFLRNASGICKKNDCEKDLERFFGLKGCVISKLISEYCKRDHIGHDIGKFQHFADIFGIILHFLNRSFKISRRL